MNERIKELYKQSCRDSEGYLGNPFDPDKFAKLIIEECAKVSERTGVLNEADFEGAMIADAIKEHFNFNRKDD